jgi:hypothetical protein
MAWLISSTTETAVVDKPAEEEDHGHGHHGHAHWNELGAPPGLAPGVLRASARDLSPQGRGDLDIRGQGLMNRATFADVQ